MSLQHLLRVRCTECLHIKHTPRPNRLSVQWRLECLAALFAVLVLEGGVAARPAAAPGPGGVAVRTRLSAAVG